MSTLEERIQDAISQWASDEIDMGGPRPGTVIDTEGIARTIARLVTPIPDEPPPDTRPPALRYMVEHLHDPSAWPVPLSEPPEFVERLRPYYVDDDHLMWADSDEATERYVAYIGSDWMLADAVEEALADEGQHCDCEFCMARAADGVIRADVEAGE